MSQTCRQPVQGPKRLAGSCIKGRAYDHQLLKDCLNTARVPAPYSSDLKRGRVKKHVIRGAKADVDRLAFLVRRELGQSTNGDHEVRFAANITVLIGDLETPQDVFSG